MARSAAALQPSSDSLPLRLPIGEVGRLTGLRPGTLRNWEERYRLLTPARTAGGTRLYSRDDVKRIREIQNMLRRNGNSLLAVAHALDRRRGRPGRRKIDAIPKDREAPTRLAKGAAAASQAQRFDEQDWRRRISELEAQMAATAAASLELESVLATICNRCVVALSADRVAIWLQDEAGVLRLAAHAGTPAPEGVTEEIRISVDFASQFGLGRAVTLSELQPTAGDRAADLLARFAPKDAIVVPLRRAGALVGLLAIGDLSRPRRFTPFDVEMAEAIGRQAQLAIGNALTYGEQQRVIARLDEINRLKSNFLSTMRHELRTPLNAIIGFSELLQKRAAGELTPKQERYVNNIRQGGEQLLRLIDDILEYTRLQSVDELEHESIGLPLLLNEVAASFATATQVKGVTLTVDAPDDLPHIVGDPVRLGRAARHLIDNAIKFSEAGGRVTIAAARPAQQVEISVSDGGAGISAKDQERIFQPFVQADSSESRRYEGTGLGLAIVKRIVELHGGSMTLQSEPGSGSIFTMRLPVLTEGQP